MARPSEQVEVLEGQTWEHESPYGDRIYVVVAIRNGRAICDTSWAGQKLTIGLPLENFYSPHYRLLGSPS